MRGAITPLSQRPAPKLLVLLVLAVALTVPAAPALAHGHLTHEARRGHVAVTEAHQGQVAITEARQGHDGWIHRPDVWKGRKVG